MEQQIILATKYADKARLSGLHKGKRGDLPATCGSEEECVFVVHILSCAMSGLRSSWTDIDDVDGEHALASAADGSWPDACAFSSWYIGTWSERTRASSSSDELPEEAGSENAGDGAWISTSVASYEPKNGSFCSAFMLSGE
jgi:hypothetical protein